MVDATQRGKAPRLSVFMVTFEQELFVAEAIESVLAQDFGDWELVLGDDRSQDGTLEIARSFEARDPARIRILPDAGHLGGRENFLRTMGACRGEYAAWLDGDDYWTSSTKLRRQVELLDAHPDCSACFHASVDVDPEGRPMGRPYYPPGRKRRYTSFDLARGNVANSCSVVFRRGVFGDFPDWFREAPVGDWPLLVLCSRHGDLGYLDEVLSAHRNHPRGVWVRRSAAQRIQSKMRTRELLLRHLGPEYEGAIEAGQARDHLKLAREYRREGEWERERAHLEWCREHGAPGRHISATRFWPRYLRALWRTRGRARAEER